MTWHPDESLLQDFLEELLPREDEERVGSHLAECSRCREEVKGLSELLSELAGLPQEAQPSRDLWPQIAWRVGDGVAPEQPRDGSMTRPRRRGVTFSAWQLMAASLAVALFSGASVWAFLSGTGEAPSSLAYAPPVVAQTAGLPDALTAYDEAVADLEAVLEQGRDVLDEETIHLLEVNLKIIDRAIQDAQEALIMDPASGLLQRVLAGNLRRKVGLLRQAALAVYANS